MKIFLYSSSMYSFHLFLISSVLLGPYLSALYWAHLCMKCSLCVSNFLEEIFSLSCSIVFLHFFALITEEGFLISLLSFGILLSNGYIFPFLLCFQPLFFSQLFVRPLETTILPFGISFSWGWSWSLPPVQCQDKLSIVLQALYQIESLESISHLHCIIVRDLI